MAFNIFANSTLANAVEMNENYYHIGQETRLPMGGSTLTSTDSAYNLGSSTATWNNVFSDNISFVSVESNNQQVWSLISRVEVTISTLSFDFTGLNGDTSKNYMIKIFSPTVDTTAVYLLFNNSGATDSAELRFISTPTTSGDGLSITAVKAQDYNFWSYYFVTGTFGDMDVIDQFNAQSDLARSGIISFIKGATGTTIEGFEKMFRILIDVSGTITSMTVGTVYNQLVPSTTVELWGRT
jgi:hypothetical protein